MKQLQSLEIKYTQTFLILAIALICQNKRVWRFIVIFIKIGFILQISKMPGESKNTLKRKLLMFFCDFLFRSPWSGKRPTFP